MGKVLGMHHEQASVNRTKPRPSFQLQKCPFACCTFLVISSKTVQLKVENSAQTISRFSLVRFCAPMHAWSCSFSFSPGPDVIKLFVRYLRIFVLSQSVCQTRLENIARNKHSSLLRKLVKYRQKSIITFGPRYNALKLFTSVIYKCS